MTIKSRLQKLERQARTRAKYAGKWDIMRQIYEEQGDVSELMAQLYSIGRETMPPGQGC